MTEGFLYRFIEGGSMLQALQPEFFAGLGVPFSFSRDISFAKPVVYEDYGTTMLWKQIEKHTGHQFFFCEKKDAYGLMDYRCKKCAIAWTKDEVRAASTGDLSVTQQTHLASPLRRDHDGVFANRILKARHCKSCEALLCADCTPPTRGKNARHCDLCRPKVGWR